MRTGKPWRWIAASLLMVSSGCGAMLPAPEVEGDYEIVSYYRYGECPGDRGGRDYEFLRVEEKLFNAVVVSRCEASGECYRMNRLSHRGDGVWVSEDSTSIDPLIGGCLQRFERIELVAWPDGQLSLHKLEIEGTGYGESCEVEVPPEFVTCEKELEVEAVPLG